MNGCCVVRYRCGNRKYQHHHWRKSGVDVWVVVLQPSGKAMRSWMVLRWVLTAMCFPVGVHLMIDRHLCVGGGGFKWLCPALVIQVQAGIIGGGQCRTHANASRIQQAQPRNGGLLFTLVFEFRRNMGVGRNTFRQGDAGKATRAICTF